MNVDEIIEQYPYLKDRMKDTLFVSEKEFSEMDNDNKIMIGSYRVPILFLRKILHDDFYFEYAHRFFMDEIDRFDVTYIINGDIGKRIGVPKSVIIKALDRLVRTNKLLLGPYEKQRFDELKSIVYFDKLLEKQKGNNYNVIVDGKVYSIPIEQLLSFLNMPDNKFDEVCLNDNIKSIAGIPKEHFVHTAAKFFKEYQLENNYIIPRDILFHFHEIERLQKVDIEAINRFVTTTDSKYKNIHLNEELKSAIVKDIPSELTQLEKAIYIYIKMCKLLTYDEEYYAINQKGEAANKHKDLDYISKISLDNNGVVCFEFNIIYSKLLDELGIHFSSDYRALSKDGEAYGDGHVDLEFRSGKFLVRADSVTSILQGDIMQAKLNQPLVGLRCKNKNYKTHDEFKASLSKVYNLIARQDKSIEVTKNVEHTQTLEELLEEYSRVTKNIQDVPFAERLSILIDKVNSTNLVGIDAYSYVLQLRKLLFNERQRDNNIVVSIVRNNEPTEEEKVAMPKAIIAFNLHSFNIYPEITKFYYYSPSSKLVPVTIQELQDKFDNNIYEYITKDDPKIPGLIEGEKIL